MYSISTCTVPDGWKKGIIVPIPKTNPPSKDKLRYITLQPLPLKLLERIILKNVWIYFLRGFGPEQHGFRTGASTTTALVSLIDSASRLMNESSLFGVAIASFDMTSAFDNVNCSLAIHKMHDAGFPSPFVHWLQDYFINRSSFIKVKRHLSAEVPLSRGVPQGSVLGPPIFCLYIRDIIGSALEITTVKYADDINLVIPLHSSSERDIQTRIDSETLHIRQLCSDCCFKMNLEKSKVLLISRRKVIFDSAPILPVCNTIKVLGVILNDKLHWKDHVEYVCKKSCQRLHIIRKLKPFISDSDLHAVYISVIRSLLEYASPVFVGLTKQLSDKLVRVDKRAHRIMAHYSPEGIPSVHCGCTKFTLNERRLRASESLYLRIETNIHDHVLKNHLPSRLPNSNYVSVPLALNSRHFNSFFPFMSRFINLQLQRRPICT